MGGLSSLAVVTCIAAFVFGMILALLGALKLKLARAAGNGRGPHRRSVGGTQLRPDPE